MRWAASWLGKLPPWPEQLTDLSAAKLKLCADRRRRPHQEAVRLRRSSAHLVVHEDVLVFTKPPNPVGSVG
jgi:hypothetical protein